MNRAAEILMVDDNPADVDLTREVLSRGRRRFRLESVSDGDEALAFLRRQGKYSAAALPDLMLLDLNLPRCDGRRLLSQVKADPELARIPVVIFTTSQARSDVLLSYELGANGYLHKPGTLPEFVASVSCLAEFWLERAILPSEENS